MKKQLLSFLMLGVVAASAQNVNIPDANFKAYLVGNTAINTNSDTEIQVSEAQAFSGSMVCVNKDVQDFTGIEEFVNITGLNVSMNDMVYLDVTQNTNLNTFYCSNCFYLSAVNLANGNNTAITTFGSDACNNLLNIQVDDISWSTSNWTNKDVNTNFVLDCSDTEINIPDANLKAFLVGNISINTNSDTEIQWTEALAYTSSIICNQQNISDMTGVGTFININKLDCSQNNLSGSLDVSNNRKLTELNFEFNSVLSIYLDKNVDLVNLFCLANSLSSLDVSMLANLVRLSCSQNYLSSLDLSNNLLLEKLYCSNNSLTSLDLSQHAVIWHLDCGYNNITELDLSLNPDWWEVHCDNNQLTSLNIANGNNSSVTYFYANSNPSLNCIEVDDAAWSTANWTQIDAHTAYSENCAASGISNQDSNMEVSIYPNPTTSQLNIQTEAEVLEVQITNLAGQVLLISTDSKINIDHIQSGVYLVTTLTNKGATTQTLIRE